MIAQNLVSSGGGLKSYYEVQEPGVPDVSPTVPPYRPPPLDAVPETGWPATGSIVQDPMHGPLTSIFMAEVADEGSADGPAAP